MKFTDLGDKGPQFKLKDSVDEASLAQMRDYFAGKMSLTDEPTKSKPGALARMRDHFSKEKPMAGRSTAPNAITSKMPPDIVMILHAINKGTAITRAQFNRLQSYKMYGESVEGNLKEFAPVGGDDREPNEEEILRQLAAQWWNGTEQQMAKAQKTLASMGWEIGQDESGDDDAGVFVIRAGDINGNSYMAFNHSDLDLNEGVTEAEGPGRVDPILYKALARMSKGGYDDAKIALAIEFGLLDLKNNYAIANNYIPKLIDLYNQKYGVAEGSESDAYGNTGEKHECGSCDGTGIDTHDDECPECGGKGWVRDKESSKKKGVAEGRRDYNDLRDTGFGRPKRDMDDESNLLYIYKDGRVHKAMISNRVEREARAQGYRDTPEQALKMHSIIRSKFKPGEWIQKQGNSWVPVYPFGRADDVAESATAGATSAANVSVGAVYKNKPVKAAKNKDGTIKNALDSNANLLTGGSLKR